MMKPVKIAELKNRLSYYLRPSAARRVDTRR